MKVHPYLFFDGKAEEAIEFYKKAVGAELEFMMRFKESPDPGAPPELGELIMHAQIIVGDSQIWISDGQACTGKKATFEGVSLAISTPDAAAAERMFNALSEGGKIQQPLIKTFFSPAFGMTEDKYGVAWLIAAEQKM